MKTPMPLFNDVVSLKEEMTPLRSIINALSNDVKKGEGTKMEKKNQSLSCKSKSKSPSKLAPPPPSPSLPPPKKKKKPTADVQARRSQEAEVIEAMSLAGASHEQVINPILQWCFIAKRRAEEARRKVSEEWIGHSTNELIL